MYKVKYKPYNQFIGIIDGRYKQCTDKEKKHIILEKKPTKEEIKKVISGMIDWSRDIVFDFPHRIKDKELEDIEIVEFKEED